MSTELETLLDELARRHARGEPLDVEQLLTSAGDRSDELARMIETFLARAARSAPSDASLAFVRSLDEPPMLRARVARKLRVDDLVDTIVEACGLRSESRRKVRRYYQQLEGGVLDPEPVAESVWEAITSRLGRSRRSLTAPNLDVTPAAAPMYRADALFELAEPPLPADPEPPDEVDTLFLGERE